MRAYGYAACVAIIMPCVIRAVLYVAYDALDILGGIAFAIIL